MLNRTQVTCPVEAFGRRNRFMLLATVKDGEVHLCKVDRSCFLLARAFKDFLK